MLIATQNEIDHVTEYVQSQAPALSVEFLQKVYSEQVMHVRHDIWDAHTSGGRCWVITGPTNLYAQEQFPNMDLALTFHVGLCLRVPRSERQQLADIPAEPFIACFRNLNEASEALARADELADYQGVGVRCRETLLTFVTIAQDVVPQPEGSDQPKGGDFKAWVTSICAIVLAGDSHKHRRHLFKSTLENVWNFANWLTHSKSSTWYDAEAAVSATGTSVDLCISTIIRHLRGVPEQCPACGSRRLSPERGIHTDHPEQVWERPTCAACGWTGKPVSIDPAAQAGDEAVPASVEGECVIPTVALRGLERPGPRRYLTD